jgi:hypothetical protein
MFFVFPSDHQLIRHLCSVCYDVQKGTFNFDYSSNFLALYNVQYKPELYVLRN